MKMGTPQEFVGRSTDADAPFLGASFWQVGVSISGKTIKAFDSRPDINKPVQRCYVIELDTPVEIDGEEWDRVSVGNLAGFKMALESMKPARLDGLKMGDRILLECDSIKPAKKENYSPRINFVMRVSRG